LKSSTTAIDIDDALILLPNFADGHIQSAPLKECIEHILATKEEILNSKSKRMLKRKLSAMGGESTAVDAIPEPKRAKKADPAPVMTPEELKKTPYIVFIGQLTYDTTADDVTNFLRSSGIEGPLQVRMLTDKTTGQSKGQCFVTLEGSREMNKCIALHQSLLNNRRINIEKSVGGKNKDARTVKLRETRLQLKIRHSEQIDAIIATHTRNSNLAPITSDFLLNKLYRLTAIEVDKILKKFTEMPNTMRKMTVLDKIVSDLLVSNKKV
jgi:RNA recognition motif-containing protein